MTTENKPTPSAEEILQKYLANWHPFLGDDRTPILAAMEEYRSLPISENIRLKKELEEAKADAGPRR